MKNPPGFNSQGTSFSVAPISELFGPAVRTAEPLFAGHSPDLHHRIAWVGAHFIVTVDQAARSDRHVDSSLFYRARRDMGLHLEYVSIRERGSRLPQFVAQLRTHKPNPVHEKSDWKRLQRIRQICQFAYLLDK